MENNDSIQVQSNSKRARIKVNLANLPTVTDSTSCYSNCPLKEHFQQ
jgi:hypothetical protein